MAKKVVAVLKKEDAKGVTRVIKMVKSPKSGAYVFKEDIVPQDLAKETLNNIK